MEAGPGSTLTRRSSRNMTIHSIEAIHFMTRNGTSTVLKTGERMALMLNEIASGGNVGLSQAPPTKYCTIYV